MVRPLKWYKSLSESKARFEEGRFLLEGKKNIDQVCIRAAHLIEEVLVEKEFESDALRYNVPVRVIERHQMLSVSSVKTPQGIVALVKIPEETYSCTIPSEPGNRILLLENIQDPGNIGTLIRTAAAFSYSGVILSSQCADLFSPKVVQATAGCLFSSWLRRTTEYFDIVKFLKKNDYKVYVADVHGEPHVDFCMHAKQVLALGSEGAGLTKEMTALADVRFSIPIESTHAESLNVAVSGGIVMFASANGIRWG